MALISFSLHKLFVPLHVKKRGVISRDLGYSTQEKFWTIFYFGHDYKVNLHQTIYLLERHCRFEESKVDFEFLSWVVGRLGVSHLRLVRWGHKSQKNVTRIATGVAFSGLLWGGNMHSCCDCSRWRNQMLVRITIFFSSIFFWFAPNSINSGEEVRFSPFQIRAAHSKNSRRLGAKAFRWVKAKKSLHSRKGDQIFRSSP